MEWLRSFLSVEGRPVPYESLMQIERQVPSRVMYLPFVNGAGSHRIGHGGGHENRNYQGSLLESVYGLRADGCGSGSLRRHSL